MYILKGELSDQADLNLNFTTKQDENLREVT